MSQLRTPILTDTWVRATWDEYLQAMDELDSEKAKGYYDNGYYRFAMTPVGFDRSCDHTIVIFAVNLDAVLKQIKIKGLSTCSLRKIGVRELHSVGDRE
jgi:hypothetical protein